MNRLVRVPWLVLVWVAPGGRLSLANLTSGGVVAVVLLTVVPVRGAPRRPATCCGPGPSSASSPTSCGG